MFPWREGRSLRGRFGSALRIVGVLLAALISFAYSEDRNALWSIVHGECLPGQQAHNDPAPCARVDLTRGLNDGYAVLKDRVGVAQFLLIATRRISGIESPDLLLPNAPNYWSDAWQNRTFVATAAKHDLGWDKIGMAINSAMARSQDQLHIHIDCVQPDVRDLLQKHVGEISTSWAELGFNLHGDRYSARRLDAAALASEDPFKLLAASLADPTQDMARETLVVAGVMFASGQNGFVLLAHADQPGHPAHGEDLLDHSCALATAE